MIRQLLFIVATIVVSMPAYSACNIVNGVAYGDCSSVNVSSASKGILRVTSYFSESGIIAGANISKGGYLNLSGISNGNISVSKGGRLVVSGIVNGVVSNSGGSVKIEGTVTSVIANSGLTTIAGIVSHVDGKGKIKYKTGAVINGKPKWFKVQH